MAKASKPKEPLLPLLVEAAEALVESEGRRLVTLRGVAEHVSALGRSVTHTAAFAHVGGQLELLAYVAANWWGKLAAELASTAPEASAPRRLVSLGVKYREFAASHPRQFRVMYDEEIWEQIEAHRDAARALLNDTVTDQPVRAPRFHNLQVLGKVAAGRNAAFACFVEAAAAGVRSGSLRQDVDAELIARSIASLSHGLAMEALDERLPSDDLYPILELAVDGLSSRNG